MYKESKRFNKIQIKLKHKQNNNKKCTSEDVVIFNIFLFQKRNIQDSILLTSLYLKLWRKEQ